MINVFKYLEGCRVEKGGEFVLGSFRRQLWEQREVVGGRCIFPAVE